MGVSSMRGTAVADRVANFDTVPGLRVSREPNFFIVGAPRAGTTTLWYMLRQHPDVFMPRHKEPYHYCDCRAPFAVKDPEAYLGLFASARHESAVGEASAMYLTSPETPKRLRTRHPDAKIVIMLREPVARAYSMYRLICSLGFEWLSPFEKAIEAEATRMTDERFKTANPYFLEAYLYFSTGLVAAALQRYFDAFPPDQIRVIFLDDFKKDPIGSTRATFEFLGVDPDFEPDLEPQNVSSYPFWVRGHHAVMTRLRRETATRTAGPLTRRERWLGFASNLNLLLGDVISASSVSRDTKRRLTERYAEDIQATSRLTGRNLDAWLR